MSRPALLLLHGALGASDQFAPLAPLLNDRFAVHTFDFAGHGAAPLQGREFSMDGFAGQVRSYLNDHAIAQAHLFGYSMGGYVAFLLALVHPERVAGIMTLGTKFAWDPAIAAREVGLLDPAKIAAKVPRFAQALAARHTALGWETVLAHTRTMLTTLGEQGGLRPEAVSGIAQRVRICLGDRDGTTTLAESAAIYRALPHGELEVFPGTRHEIDRVAPARLAARLVEFFAPEA